MAWGDGSGGGSSRSGGWGGGGGARTGTAGKPRKRNPEHDLASTLVRLARTRPRLSGSQRDAVDKAIIANARGLSTKEYRRVISAVPSAPSGRTTGEFGGGPAGAGGATGNPNETLRARLEQQLEQTRNTHGAIGAVFDAEKSVAGKVLNTVSAPLRYNLSALAEASRQGEKHPVDIGPVSLRFLPTDPGKVVEAGIEGFQNKRHDTPLSIAKKAGEIREKQGKSTRAFGVIPGTDLKKNPIGFGKAGNIVYDVGGSIALDPLTYVTFGLGAEAKAGIRGATEALGAERTAALVEKGPSVLTAAERAALEETLSPKVFKSLMKGVRGGVKVSLPRFPTRSALSEGKYLSEARTIIPGPLRGLRAAKIIEGTAGQSAEVRAAATAAEDVAGEAAERAKEFHARANLAELSGAHSDKVAQLRHEADQFDELAARAGEKATSVRGTASKEASTVAERLRDTPIGRALAKVRDNGAVSTIRRIFIPREAVRAQFGEGVANQLDAARVKYRGTFQANVEDDVNTLLHAARETGVTNDELVNVIGPALDINGASKVAAIPEKLRPMYDALVKVRDRFTQAQIDAGVVAEQALHVTDEYFPRVLTEEAKQVMGKEGVSLTPPVPGEATLTRGPSGHLRKRTADIDQPISAINAKAIGRPGAGAAGPVDVTALGVPKFEENPLTAFSKRSIEANQDIATKQFADDITKVTDASGNPVMRAAKEGERVPEGAAEVVLPGAGRYFAPKEIASEVTKARELLINDETLRTFVDGLDRWMTLWKGYATVPLPFGLGFHMRNGMGNVFNNWLADISPADAAYGQAARIQHLAAKGAKDGDIYKYLSAHEKRIVKAARENDIIGEGFYGVDLPKHTNEPVQVPFSKASRQEKIDRLIGKKGERLHGSKGGALRPLNPNNALIASGRKLGRSIEENARLAHFIKKMDEFGNAADAAASVRKYLFDYSDLTAVERQGFKRVMAFYCVPEDHEILTRRGWLRHGDLVLGEDVMVFDPQTHEMRWEPLLDVATFDFDGELNTFERRGGTFHFTDDHRWPIETTGGHRSVVRAHELNTASLVPLTGEFDDGGADSLLSPRLAAILGWIVTDGHGRWTTPNHYRAVVYQSPKKHLVEIEELLGETRRGPHPDTGVFYVPVKIEDRKAITKHYREKADLPSLVTHLSREAAEAMWQAMFKAEGNTVAATGQQNFSQQHGPVAEAFQILSYMTGRAVWLSRGPHINNYMRRSKFLRVKEGIGRTPYTGTIWCPQTPTGTWLMRHEGAVIPTGNTFTRKNLPLQVGALLRTPGKFSHLQAARVGVADNAEAPKGLYPSYLPEVGGVPLPMAASRVLSKVPGLGVKSDQQLVYAPDLPFYNATNIASPAVQLLAELPGAGRLGLPKNEQGISGAVTDLLNQGVSGGAPGALMTAVQAAGAEKEFFSGRPLQGRVAAPSYALPFAQNRVLNGKMQPTITAKQQYVLESLMPILGKLSSAFPQGDYEQEKAPRRRLSSFTGQRVYPLGPGASRGEALRRNSALYRLIADLRAAGIDIASSRTKKGSSGGWAG